jgi:A/G-specific adenine glycosylase
VVPVMDGNVLRVVSRYLGIELPMDKPEGRRLVMDALHQWIPADAPDTFNQAMMEFGALQCTPKIPSCDNCIFIHECTARKENRVAAIPFKSAKTKVKDFWIYYMVIEVDGRLLMRRREESGIWKGLYDFPSVDADQPLDVARAIEEWKDANAKDLGFELKRVIESPLHLLSHRRIHACFIELSATKQFSEPTSCSWVKDESVHSLGVSRLVDRYLQQRESSSAVME